MGGWWSTDNSGAEVNSGNVVSSDDDVKVNVVDAVPENFQRKPTIEDSIPYDKEAPILHDDKRLIAIFPGDYQANSGFHGAISLGFLINPERDIPRLNARLEHNQSAWNAFNQKDPVTFEAWAVGKVIESHSSNYELVYSRYAETGQFNFSKFVLFHIREGLNLTFKMIDHETAQRSYPTLYDVLMRMPVNDDFYRLFGDDRISYGDGGDCLQLYPAWIFPQLRSFGEDARQKLLLSLNQIASERNDFQNESPIEDMIDPDLFPRIIPSDSVQYEVRKSRVLSSENLSNEYKFRSGYQWITSEFHVSEEGKVNIVSDIHNLTPRGQYEDVYDSFGQLFECMLPGFSELGLWKQGVAVTLKVIVKAQKYHLKPGMSYTGNWHVEGRTEKITAVGVYYCERGSDLKGGDLKFRNASVPNPFQAVGEIDHSVDIKQGTCLVFSNILPHRHRKISNDSEVDSFRTFVNFFIVDPAQADSIPSTADPQWSTSIFWEAAEEGKAVNDEANPQFPWKSLKHAQEFRGRARECLRNLKAGWGYYFWGNCGEIEFIPDPSALLHDGEIEHNALQNSMSI
jgi:hypothetical protein